MFSSIFASSSSSFQARFTNFFGEAGPYNDRGALTVSANQHSSVAARVELEGGASLRVDGLAVFERAMAMGYQKLQEQLQLPVYDEVPALVEGEAPGVLTAEKVAGNILGFIERRLMLDVAEGATVEELASRLEAGLKGFEQGFEEAREQIEALGFLTPEIDEDIGKTYDLVIEGIEGLREKYLESDVPDVREKTAPLAANDEQPPSLSAVALGAASYDFAQRNTFSFELQTTDGDSVTITASAGEAYATAYSAARFEGEEGSLLSESFTSSYSNSNSFHLEIDGELDTDELHAINKLLGQVNSLASDFYAGDLDRAFEQALELNYDSSEITAFALNLTHSEVQKVTGAYQSLADSGSDRPPQLAERLLPLGHFVRDLLDALDSAAQFGEPVSLLMDLADKLAEHHQGASLRQDRDDNDKRLYRFVDRLLKDLEA